MNRTNLPAIIRPLRPLLLTVLFGPHFRRLMFVVWAATVSPSFAATLHPIPTSGHDQDIFFESGLAVNAVGTTGELGSRNFFQAGAISATDNGVPQTLPPFNSTVTGNTINFAFAPFAGNNVIKLDTVTVGPKTLTLTTPRAYRNLAVVLSGASLATATEFAVVPYTINYANGATQTGELAAPDWGATPAALTPNTLDLFNAARTTADNRMWLGTSDNNTVAGRWSISVQEVISTLPNANIASITFGQPQLNQNGNVVALLAGDDVVVYGLAGALIPEPSTFMLALMGAVLAYGRRPTMFR
jgi:hypothetical protein